MEKKGNRKDVKLINVDTEKETKMLYNFHFLCLREKPAFICPASKADAIKKQLRTPCSSTCLPCKLILFIYNFFSFSCALEVEVVQSKLLYSFTHGDVY